MKINVTDTSSFCVNSHDYTSAGIAVSAKLYSDGAEIKDLEIPGNVETIVKDAFYNCDNLTSVTLTNGVNSIGDNAFRDCDNISELKINVTDMSSFCVNSHDYTSVGIAVSAKLYSDGAEITEVVIPSGVESIVADAFYNCPDLTSVVLTDGINDMSPNAFQFCENIGELKINISDMSTFCGNSHNYTSAGLSVPVRLYSDNEEITEMVIPEEVETIVTGAFYNCTGLTALILPEKIQSVNQNAFQGCENYCCPEKLYQLRYFLPDSNKSFYTIYCMSEKNHLIIWKFF